jgi:hypothetical protein
MPKSQAEFLIKEFDNGRKTIIMLKGVTVVISREPGKNGYDVIHINIEDVDIMKRVKHGAPVSEVSQQRRKKEGNNNQTAGEVPFVMFFAKKMRDKFNSEDCVGNVVAQKAALLDLASYIEMRTGRICKGWENDSHNGTASMTLSDIAKAIGKKERQARVVVDDLIANKILKKKKEGYFLDRDYFVRGKTWETETHFGEMPHEKKRH